VTAAWNRRELITVLGCGAMAWRTEAAARVRPGVVGVASVDKGSVNPSTCRAAVADAVCRATASGSAGDALATLFRPDDMVGIKVNCLAGRGMSPHVEMVDALVELLAAAGVQRQRIVVFDRSSRELEGAGFTIRRSGGPYLCFGTDNDYDPQPTTSGQIGSCFSRLVSSVCTALISFGVVKDHDLAGVSAGLKNWYGVIHNPNKYHDSNCNPYVADVVRHDLVRSKLRLTVLDGVIAQCRGGPALNPAGLFDLSTVAASTDPVAVDAWAWGVIDAERTRRGMPTLEEQKRPPAFIATAARYGLGVGDRAKLQVVSG